MKVDKLKIILIILYLLTSSFLFASDWTIFFYMAADNDLYQHAVNDIIEMQKGLLNGHGNVKIIVYMKSGRKIPTKGDNITKL